MQDQILEKSFTLSSPTINLLSPFEKNVRKSAPSYPDVKSPTFTNSTFTAKDQG